MTSVWTLKYDDSTSLIGIYATEERAKAKLDAIILRDWNQQKDQHEKALAARQKNIEESIARWNLDGHENLIPMVEELVPLVKTYFEKDFEKYAKAHSNYYEIEEWEVNE